MKKAAWIILAILVAGGAFVFAAGSGWLGQDEQAGPVRVLMFGLNFLISLMKTSIPLWGSWRTSSTTTYWSVICQTGGARSMCQ